MPIKMSYSFVFFMLLFFSMNSNAAYPLANIKNNTDYRISGTVHYASAFCSNGKYSVAPGKTWKAKSRGVCLITKITGKMSGKSKHGENLSITPYSSTGTSYSQFQINAYGGRYRIFSKQEYAKVSKTKHGKGPGFRLVNKTDWPVAYSLEQVGCLYHDVMPARWNRKDGVRVINTGAVWFTLRVHIQPDGINPQTDMDCIKPVAELVGDVLLAVAETAATGGAAGPAAVTKVVVKQVAKQALKTAVKATVTNVSTKMAKKIGQYMSEAGTVTMAGQYAGYEWPFRCDKMPEYHITGGPKMLSDGSGQIYLSPGKPFTVRKVNSCGNDMMIASPKLATAKPSIPFPDEVNAPQSPVSDTLASKNNKSGVTVYQHCNFGGYAVNLSPGRYNLRQLRALGIKNDDLSSVRVKNGMQAKVYQHDNFKGKSWVISSNESCFVNKGLNDTASSIVISAKKKTINGFNVNVVKYKGGQFKQVRKGNWSENGRFNFKEKGRDEWSVYLFDVTRNVNIQLDLYRKKIVYSAGNGAKSDLYNIVNYK